MDRQQLRDAQSPLKEKYRNDPASAVVTLRASGTLGVSKEAPVGFRDIRLHISIDADAAEPERRKLPELTERYCVVYQTLIGGPSVRMAYAEARA